MAELAVAKKTANKGTSQEQQYRRNGFSMANRCRRQVIKFWPIAIETDGCASASFPAFFKIVCDATGTNTTQNITSFTHYWRARLAYQYCHVTNATSHYMHFDDTSCDALPKKNSSSTSYPTHLKPPTVHSVHYNMRLRS